QHHQQPDDEYQPDQNPEAGLIAKAVIADQYVAGVLGDGPADCTNDGEQDDEEQSKPLHVRRSSSLACSSSPVGASSVSTGSSPWSFRRFFTSACRVCSGGARSGKVTATWREDSAWIRSRSPRLWPSSSLK